MKNYIESKNVKMFPTAFRGTGAENKVFDPEARLNTEHNLTTLLRYPAITPGYVIEWTGSKISFVLNGYYFEVNDLTDTTTGIVEDADLEIWAYIRVLADNAGASEYEYENLRIRNQSLDDNTLDIAEENNIYRFGGLYFSSTEDTSKTKQNGYYKLQLLERESSTAKWDVPSSSKIFMSSDNICNKGSSSTPISSSFSTDSLLVNGDTSLNGNLTVGANNDHEEMTLYGNLDVKGNTSITGSLSVESSNVEVYPTQPKSGGIYIGDKDSSLHFTSINLNSINTTIKAHSQTNGTPGTINLEGDTTITGNTILNGITFVNGALNVGTDSVPKNTYLNGKTYLNGNTYLDGDLIVGASGNLKNTTLNGTTTVNGDLIVGTTDTSGSITLRGDLEATEETTLNSLKVNGDTTLNGTTEFNGTTDFNENAYFHKNLYVGTQGNWKDITVNGDLDVRLQLTVGSKATFNNDIEVANNAIIHGQLDAEMIVATSDLRKKQNIEDYNCEHSILDLPIKKFEYINDDSHTKHIGCIAQDLQQICPEIVHEDSEGYLKIEESKLVYLLLQEIKELKQQVSELQQKIN